MIKKNLSRVLAFTAMNAVLLGATPNGGGHIERFGPSNWDWTKQEKWTIYFSNSNVPFPGIASAMVANPYWISGHGMNIDQDMYPEDGWALVYKDFGTPSEAGPIPSFALYNRFSGKLRFVFYNAQKESCSNFKIKFSWANGDRQDGRSHAAANLVFSEPTQCFRSNFDPAHEELLIGYADKENGWLYFDVPMVGYDPDLNAKKPVLNFHLTAVNIGHFEASGDGGMILKQIETGQAIPGGSAKGMSDFEALKAGYKWYRDTNSWVTNELTNPKNKDAPWFPLAQTVSAALPAISTFAPYAAGLAGVITSFIGGSHSTPAPVPMNFKGKLDFGMTATYTTEIPYFRGGIQLRYGQDAPDAFTPVQPIPWGIFSIEEAPKVLVRPVYVRHPGGDDLRADWTRRPRGPGRDFQGYQCTMTGLPTMNLNPDTGLTLTSARYSLTFGEAWQSKYVDNPAALTVQYGAIPTGLSYELKFALPSHRNADPEEVIYKTVPIEVTQGAPIVLADQ